MVVIYMHTLILMYIRIIVCYYIIIYIPTYPLIIFRCNNASPYWNVDTLKFGVLPCVIPCILILFIKKIPYIYTYGIVKPITSCARSPSHCNELPCDTFRPNIANIKFIKYPPIFIGYNKTLSIKIM